MCSTATCNKELQFVPKNECLRNIVLFQVCYSVGSREALHTFEFIAEKVAENVQSVSGCNLAYRFVGSFFRFECLNVFFADHTFERYRSS